MTSQSPVVAGIVRPIVVLPSDADAWPAAQRRLILLHELGHAKRHDVLTQTLAGLVCGLNWFNPVCWFGLLQMRGLRELACDDLVIASGQQPADYADILLDSGSIRKPPGMARSEIALQPQAFQRAGNRNPASYRRERDVRVGVGTR